ncbi:MAG: nucleoside phosphorylase [Candidatus Helarchaeota archaeon]
MSEKLRMCYMMLGCGPSAISDYVIMPATPIVVNQISKKFDEKPKKTGEILKGKVNDIPISIIPSGIGAPSAACKMEGINFSKKKPIIIRLDYCGALDPEIKIGEVIVATAGLIGDGTTPHYRTDDEISIPASQELLDLFMSKAETRGLSFHAGPIWSHDALLREPPELVEKARSHGAIGIDMETTIIYALGQIFDMKTLAILVVTDNPGNNQHISQMKSFSPMILKNIDESMKVVFGMISDLAEK